MSENEPKLRLIEEEENGDSIPFDRRWSERRSLRGQATAILSGGPVEEQRNCIMSVELRDMSDIGLGITTTDPIELGSRITVFFPPHGIDGGFDKFGHVVRCDENDQGKYTVGIRLHGVAIAAA